MTPSGGVELVAQALVDRGWSEQDLADHIQKWAYEHGEGTLGITRSYVSEWLNGKRGVSAPYARRISGVLGIPAGQFVDRRSTRASRHQVRAPGGFESLDHDPFGLAAAVHARWPGTRLSRLVPAYGVDWNILLPGGRCYDGASLNAQLCAAGATEDGDVVTASPGPAVAHPSSLGGRTVVVAADTTVSPPRYFILDGRTADRRLRQRSRSRRFVAIPRAYELDDLTYAITRAVANLDEALLSDDHALETSREQARRYECLPGSAVSDEAAADLTTISRMWLGSAFCAAHVLRNLDGASEPPLFWTREQQGEEASTWLLFRHKYRSRLRPW